MIEVERGKGVRGRFAWHVRGRRSVSGLLMASTRSVSGFSRTPLLDACRALKALGEDTGQRVALFRAGMSDADLVTTVGAGSDLMVKEEPCRFSRFESFPDNLKV